MEITQVTFDDLLDQGFKELLLAKLLRDWEFLAKARAIIKPSYFNSDVFFTISKCLFDWWDENHTIPTLDILKNLLVKAVPERMLSETYLATLERVYAKSDADGLTEFLSDQLAWFAQRAEAAEAVTAAASTSTSFDIPKLAVDLQRIERIPSTFLDLGLELREDWPKLFQDDPRKTFPTGIDVLDSMMRGGIREGELLSILGPTKRGKSQVLMNLGARLLLMGSNVVHYTMEMAAIDCFARYVSILTGIPTNSLQENLVSIQDLIAMLDMVTDGKLIVKEYPARTQPVSTLDGHMTLLEGKYGEPFIPIVDYADLLVGPNRRDEEWKEFSEIYMLLRNMGRSHRVGVISASQSNAGGFSAKVLGPQHLSGSTRKAFHVDYMWAIEQDEIDYALNRFALTSMLNRHGRKHEKTYWLIDYTSGRALLTDEATYASLTPVGMVEVAGGGEKKKKGFYA